MSDKAFRVILFYVLLSIFCATAVIALLSLEGIGVKDAGIREKLFTGLILEAVASIFAFWKQLSGKAFSDPPNVTGEWEYECIRDDESYKHGGTCHIGIRSGTFGWEFTISGKRTWMATRVDEHWKRKDLEAASTWENAWGTFTGSDSLRYGYSIKAGGNLVQGYGFAAVKKDEGDKPVLLEGNFFQLPPHDPFYGFQRYWRADYPLRKGQGHE